VTCNVGNLNSEIFQSIVRTHANTISNQSSAPVNWFNSRNICVINGVLYNSRYEHNINPLR
jgi:hypothetical protein